MKHLLLIVLFLSLTFSTAGQKKFSEIDLRIKGVGSATSYSTVIRKLGKPQRTKTEKVKASHACSNLAETHLTLFYSGLEITLLGDGRGRNLDVYSIEVTSPKWKASGISIGANQREVVTKFGEPDSKEENSDEATFYYATKDNYGRVNFYFHKNKLVRVSMTETLC